MLDKVLPSDVRFSPAGPFHGLVVAYLVQTHGFVDLASRGFIQELERIGPDRVAAWLESADDRQRKALERVFPGKAGPLFEDLHLASRAGQSVKPNITELGDAVFHNHREPLKRFNASTAGSLLILAFESTASQHTHDERWEFLRHCRNAAAHNGRFRFRHGEPRRAAKWRTLEITSALEGSPLLPDPPDPGLLAPGDVLHLLSDLEAAFFPPSV